MIMEKTCKNCKYCAVSNFEVSPGGILMVQWHECDNKDSELYKNRMSVINNIMSGGEIDGRNNNCNLFKK